MKLGHVPYAPLERLARLAYLSDPFVAPPLIDDGLDHEHGRWCDNAAAALFDVSRRQILRWRSDGIPGRVAERAAVERLNLLPGEVWGWDAWRVTDIATDLAHQIHVARRQAGARRAARQRAQLGPSAPTVLDIVDEAVAVALHQERRRHVAAARALALAHARAATQEVAA